MLISKKKMYTITFVNYDGTQLQTGEVAYGEIHTYRGETLTKPLTDEYIYTFVGWDPKIVSVKDNAVYTATYKTEANTEHSKSEGDSDESRTTSGNNTDDTSSDNFGSSNGKLGAIKTGDETNTSPSIILILISFVGLILALIPNKKHGFKPKYYR